MSMKNDNDTPVTATNGTRGPVKCTFQQRGQNSVVSFVLAPGESRQTGVPGSLGMWISFRDLGNHTLASTLVDNTVSGVVLVQSAITIGLVQRLDPVSPTNIANSTKEPVQAEMQLHGSSTIDRRELAPIGQVGASWDTGLNKGEFWVGFFSLTDRTTFGSSHVDAQEYTEVALTEPRAEFTITATS